jgi:hypothetical protein
MRQEKGVGRPEKQTNLWFQGARFLITEGGLYGHQREYAKEA